MSKCSFGKFSIKDFFTPEWPFCTDMYCRMFYLQSDREQFLLCVMDSCDTFPAEANRFRLGLAEALGMPAKSVWYHELQLHAAPGSRQLRGEAMDKILAAAIPAARDMIDRAEEFDAFVTEADFGTECSFNREQYIEGFGGVTVWTGIRYDDQGRACTKDPKVMNLRGYIPDLPIFDKPIYFDNTVDPKAYLFRFADKQGNTIGTISRFAAHPDVGVLFEHSPQLTHEFKMTQYQYCYDWCGYLSEKLESEFGGISMYTNGPCADITSVKCPPDNINGFEDSRRECERLGLLYAERLIDSFAKEAQPMKNTDFLRTETFDITLPMRDDMPTSRADGIDNEAANVEAAVNAMNKAIADGEHPSMVKHLIDQCYFSIYRTRMIDTICNFTDEQLAERKVTIPVPAMRFGEYLFVGMPGESLVEMSVWLRSEFTGVKTIPVDQCNGYYAYMATPRSFTLGGYTYWSSWVNRHSIPTLKAELYPLLKDFLAKD